MKRQPGEFNHVCVKCKQKFRNRKIGVCGDKPLCPTCEGLMSSEELQAHRAVEKKYLEMAKRRRKRR